jgi:hypothetical protein
MLTPSTHVVDHLSETNYQRERKAILANGHDEEPL